MPKGNDTHATMTLYDKCVPFLKAGDKYVLEVSQKISGMQVTSENDTSEATVTTAFNVEIDGPQYSLDPSEIHSQYPPANSEGTYQDHLATVVLKNKALPWLRQLPWKDGTPWLALLLLTPEEEKVCTLETVDHPSDDKLKCTRLSIPEALFDRIAPTPEEAAPLAHVRQVDRENKELLGDDDDGFLSVIISNRIIIDEGPYLACLCSMEDHQGPKESPGWSKQKFRHRYVLSYWRFKSKGLGDFRNLMRGLEHRGILMLGQGAFDPASAIMPGSAPASDPQLDPGFVYLSYATREGEENFALYRGPLAPLPMKLEPEMCFTAEDAKTVDLDGTPHLHYAAAFELGRLLALSDQSFAMNLARWRHGQYQSKTKTGMIKVLTKVIPPFLCAKFQDPRDWVTLSENMLTNSVALQNVMQAQDSGAEKAGAGPGFATATPAAAKTAQQETRFDVLEAKAKEEFVSITKTRKTMTKAISGGDA